MILNAKNIKLETLLNEIRSVTTKWVLVVVTKLTWKNQDVCVKTVPSNVKFDGDNSFEIWEATLRAVRETRISNTQFYELWTF